MPASPRFACLARRLGRPTCAPVRSTTTAGRCWPPMRPWPPSCVTCCRVWTRSLREQGWPELPIRVKVQCELNRSQASVWCRLSESNGRPSAYKAGALPTELSRRCRAANSRLLCRAKRYLTRLSDGRADRSGSGGSGGPWAPQSGARRRWRPRRSVTGSAVSRGPRGRASAAGRTAAAVAPLASARRAGHRKGHALPVLARVDRDHVIDRARRSRARCRRSAP